MSAPRGWKPTGSLTTAHTINPSQLPPLERLELKARLISSERPTQCGWVRVKGIIKVKRGARLTRSQRSALKGLIVSLSAFKPEISYPLDGEARLNSRGAFDITARLPLSAPLSPLELHVSAALPDAPPSLFANVMK